MNMFHAYRSRIDGSDADTEYFARCLLMPVGSFTREFEKAKGAAILDVTRKFIVAYLCDVFQVPWEQCETRVCELGLG